MIPSEQLKSQPTATEEYLKKISGNLWTELSSLPVPEQDNRWFSLTQKHLKDYHDGGYDEEAFKQEELELLLLNYLFARETADLDINLPQRGFFLKPGLPRRRLLTLGNTTEALISEIKDQHSSQPFRVLIGGVGISGKQTTRTILTKELAQRMPEQTVVSWDRDYQKLFPPVWPGDIELVEDVHGLDSGADREQGYSLAIMVSSPQATYAHTLLQRGRGWLRHNKIDLTAPDRKSSPLLDKRIQETAAELERTVYAGQNWFKEQLHTLKTVYSSGIPVMVIDPTEFFKELYGFKIQPQIMEKSFYDLLWEGFEPERP